MLTSSMNLMLVTGIIPSASASPESPSWPIPSSAAHPAAHIHAVLAPTPSLLFTPVRNTLVDDYHRRRETEPLNVERQLGPPFGLFLYFLRFFFVPATWEE